MKTVLVTGGMGFIGSHTVIALNENGYDVVIADNLVNSKREVLNRLKTITGKRFKFYNVDCCDKAALSVVFEENDTAHMVFGDIADYGVLFGDGGATKSHQ